MPASTNTNAGREKKPFPGIFAEGPEWDAAKEKALSAIVLLYPNSRPPIPQQLRAYTQFET